MEEDPFDCVIVGARCAGAPLATHLSRAGMRVCLLDRDEIPSDQPFSTHGLSPLAMDRLDELGVGDGIRAVTPKVRMGRIFVGGAAFDLPLLPGREMYCPRRSLLDPLLAEAAVRAGAVLRTETAVLEVIRDTARVVGVRARHRGKTHEIRARWVVGADGRSSTIARCVGAGEYHAATAERGGYWAYYPITPAFRALPFQTYIEITGDSSRFAFQTDGDLVIAGAFDRPCVAKKWSGDIASHVTESLMGSEVIRPLVERNAPATRFLGMLTGHWYFRTPTGPGWALVGDAGLHKDPTPGYGITDALRDAKALAAALLDGRDAALERYWRKRDVESIPFYENALAMGSLEYDNPMTGLLLAKAQGNPELTAVLRETLERTRSPFYIVPPWRVLAWVAGAMLRGRTDIWPHFLTAAKRGARVAKEVTRRTALLADAEARLAALG